MFVIILIGPFVWSTLHIFPPQILLPPRSLSLLILRKMAADDDAKRRRLPQEDPDASAPYTNVAIDALQALADERLAQLNECRARLQNAEDRLERLQAAQAPSTDQETNELRSRIEDYQRRLETALGQVQTAQSRVGTTDQSKEDQDELTELRVQLRTALAQVQTAQGRLEQAQADAITVRQQAQADVNAAQQQARADIELIHQRHYEERVLMQNNLSATIEENFMLVKGLLSAAGLLLEKLGLVGSDVFNVRKIANDKAKRKAFVRFIAAIMDEKKAPNGMIEAAEEESGKVETEEERKVDMVEGENLEELLQIIKERNAKMVPRTTWVKVANPESAAGVKKSVVDKGNEMLRQRTVRPDCDLVS